MMLRRLVPALSLLLPALALAQGVELNTITKVEVKGSSIEITGSKKPSFTTFTMTDPPRLVIDISEAVFSGVPDEMQVGNGTVTAIKTASYGSDASAIARVLIGFERELETDIQSSGSKLVVKLPAGSGGQQVAQADPAPDTAAPDTSAQDAERARQEEAQRQAQAAEAEKQRLAEAEKQRLAEAEQQRLAEAEKQRQEEATAEAERERQAEAERERQAEAERQRQQEQAQASAAEAEEARRAQAQEAQAAAEEARRRKEEEARAGQQAKADAAAERQRQQEEARAAAEAARREEQQSAASEAAERRRQQEEARAEAQRRREEEAAAKAEAAAERQRQQRLAQAAPREQAPSDTGGQLSVSGRRKTMELVGFRQQPDASRVFVRTNEPVRYTVSRGEGNTVVVELENTRIELDNNERWLDTSFFDTAVAMIDPRPGPTRTVRIEIKLKESVPYRTSQQGNELYVDFERPARR